MWYLIGYAIVALLILLWPMVSGDISAVEKDMAVLFGTGLLWPIILVVIVPVSISWGYVSATKYMHNFWEQRRTKKIRIAEEQLNIQKQMDEADDELDDYFDQQKREDYRRTHCQGCGKVV